MGITPIFDIANIFIYHNFNITSKKQNRSYIIALIYSKVIMWNLIHIISLIKNRIRLQRIRNKDDKFLFLFMENLQKFVKVYINN